MKSLLGVALLTPFLASAATLDCSTKASKMTSKGELTRMAKINEDAAKKTALDAVKTSGATVAKGGLEVEDGCLVYSYDVKVPGKVGVQEVIVDAGSGKVLAMEQEGPGK